MIVEIIAVLVGSLLGAPAPPTLDDPARAVAAAVPEGRVLFAATDRAEGDPERVRETRGPALSAASYVVVDVGSGKVLTAENPSLTRPVASLTKLLTAVTVAARVSPDAVVTVGRTATRARVAGATMGLTAGERMRVRDLLAGLLIPSANDAAVALAEHVSGSEERFAGEMNAVAAALGLSRTRVANATGFDDAAHFSSAYDMALLLAHTWRDPLLGIFLRATSLDVASVDGRRAHRLRTTNRLLGERTDILAGKTGFTDAAGESLAIVAENEDGHPVVAVLLGSHDRFSDMDNLLNWTFWAYRWPAAEGDSSDAGP